ncbi:glutaminyl-peptide cyclotransferase [Enterococcus sp. AZ188]|uniref:glutaminyl-peptide cyclotransferase n=1 Tax=Enterococcus sp. AZ188 TaxID=2774678 RepID=UPI003D2FEAB8
MSIFLYNTFAFGKSSGGLTVLKSYTYDSSLHTQGLEMDKENNRVVVSSGEYGESKIGFLDLQTGKLNFEVPLEDEFFAEGITISDDVIWQLTWVENTVFVRDRSNLEIINTYSYEDQGWGLCYTGDYLIMSNGTDELTVRNPNNFEFIKTIEITEDSEYLYGINELEYVDGYIFANVMDSDHIYKIDLQSGHVIKTYDASNLLTGSGSSEKEISTVGDLNGIAHVKDNIFLVTGKNWPKIFEVELN